MKILNGKINENGVIVPFNDSHDIIYNKAEDSLLYREYKSGHVSATIHLAEFDDGEVTCSSEAHASHTGYSYSPAISAKTERKTAITKGMERVIRFLERILAENNSDKPKSTDRDCRRVLDRIRFDLSSLSSGVLKTEQSDPLTLPLVF